MEHLLRLRSLILVLALAWLVAYEANVVVGATATSGIVFGKPASLILGFAAAALCAVGALRHRGALRVGWLLIAAGIAAWSAGDTYWTYALLDRPEIPVPSAADIGYLLFPVLGFAGLAAIIRTRVTGAARLLVWDGVAAALATAAVAAAVVVDTVAGALDGSDVPAVATNLAYPLTDLLLLGVVVGAVALQGWRLDRTWAMVGGGVLAFWLADTWYLLAMADDSYVFPAIPDAGWTLCFIGLAAAAWRAPIATAVRATIDRRSAGLPVVFAAVGVGVLVYAGLADTTPVAVALAGASLLVSGHRLWLTYRDNVVMLDASRREALTDPLTDLGNRRALTRDLERVAATATSAHPTVLVLLDLDGFKSYNDSFGHPAGDALLVRLGRSLARHIGAQGTTYRMGGDEFCVLVRPPAGMAPDELGESVASSLFERGEGFSIGCSFGAVLVPQDTGDVAEALRLADQRMYARKNAGRPSAGRQSRDVLLTALAERHPDLGEHVSTVADHAVAVARALGMQEPGLEHVRHAAELHDVGKVAIPDAILNKPGPLDDAEWRFMHRHTIIGERIVAAAPALQPVGPLVRASHERWDGTGYPDRLAGQQIPLGARIVAVCDAFDAMVAERPYRRPMSVQEATRELRRCAGSQFDPAVVEAFCGTLAAAADGPSLRAA